MLALKSTLHKPAKNRSLPTAADPFPRTLRRPFWIKKFNPLDSKPACPGKNTFILHKAGSLSKKLFPGKSL